ncbi:MAG: large subunit ribosomal protein, partial [Streptomyces sp.]|nr:large subunit ribosomal protein [Streptomyces sp.]
VVDVEISSASHPFYTGTARVMDTAGRVERFERRYGRAARTE